MHRQYYVYILSSTSKTLYIGVTNDLLRRVIEHRSGVGSKLAIRYNVHHLVYFEFTENAYAAITREKQLKSWRREKKLTLIESMNPDWRDLAVDWFEPSRPRQ